MKDAAATIELMNRIQQIALGFETLEQTPHVKRAYFSLQSALQELFHGMAADAPKEEAHA